MFNGTKEGEEEEKEGCGHEIKEKVGRKEGRQEEEMKGKLEAGMAGGGSPQLGLQQAVAEENRNISPSHCGPSTCFSSCFIISLAEGKVRTRRFPFSRCGKTADDGFPLQKCTFVSLQSSTESLLLDILLVPPSSGRQRGERNQIKSTAASSPVLPGGTVCLVSIRFIAKQNKYRSD